MPKEAQCAHDVLTMMKNRHIKRNKVNSEPAK